jgi:hypothetical protein
MGVIDQFRDGAAPPEIDATPAPSPKASEDVTALESPDERANDSESILEQDPELLKRIRDDYSYFQSYWKIIRDEAAIDMRFVSGDPWDDSSRMRREAAGLPCICPDEISQYLNQAINNLREQKRAVKLIPRGTGATDKDAKRRAAIIRGIEHEANALAADTVLFEGMINCGWGFERITTKYVSDDTDEVTPWVKPIRDGFSVYPDPNAQEMDFSDQDICIVASSIPERDFKRKYPWATKHDFTDADKRTAAQFFHDKEVVLLEYWAREYGKPKKVGRRRKVRPCRVVQYITNGVEILERNEWPGSWIPIVVGIGKEYWTRKGELAERHFASLVRTARDSQAMLAFIASQEAIEFLSIPLTPWVVAKGQIPDAARKAWENCTSEPIAFLEYDPMPDGAGAPLPPPQKPIWAPNSQAYAMSREAWRRAVQSAMGIMPMPTSAQEQNQKSGVALGKIQTQEQVGSFHFTDNFERCLKNRGRQLNELITKCIDTQRHVSAMREDGKHGLMYVTTKDQLDQIPDDIKEKDDYLVVDNGEFDVTVSSGPSTESEREAAGDVADQIMQNMGNIPPPGSPAAAIMAQSLKMRNLGPEVDALAETINPTQADIPAEAKPIIGQFQAKLQQAQQALQQQGQVLQQLQFDAKAKTADHIMKLKEIEAQHTVAMTQMVTQANLDRETKIAVAEVSTKAQSASERQEFIADLVKQFHSQSHEVALQAIDQSHERNMSQQNAQQNALQSVQEPNQSPPPTGQPVS